MNRRRILLFSAALLVLIGAVWLLWVRPKRVDMAQFAPANSLIYIEVNEPAQVLTALAKTEAWKLLNQHLDAPTFSFDGGWQRLIRATGIGPIDSVILSRSQFAVVVTNLGTMESGDVLKVKPEAALIVETHTSEHRIRAPIERHLERFVSATYKTPSQNPQVIDGVRTVQFRDNAGSGQIVAAFVGSLVVIGNSKEIVDNCVSVARRRAPSLRSNLDVQNARASRTSANELAFGYVPAEGSSKLLSAGVPIFFGQSPTDAQFQRMIQNAASKLIGSVTWTAREFRGGIEDRYVIDLQPDVVAELGPHFGAPQAVSPSNLTTELFSITDYRLENPLATWHSLKTSVSRRVDTVAAVVFNTTLKTSLTSYGIDDPETFLSAVTSPLKTIRLDQAGERQLVVATVGDRPRLIDLFKPKMPVTSTTPDNMSTIMENLDHTLSVAVNDSLIMIGHPVDVQQYYRIAREDATERNKQSSARISDYVDSESRAHIVTYANDGERIRSVASAMARVSRKGMSSTLRQKIEGLPYATTETTLTDRGLTRITRSPLGQFSAVIPLLVPNENPTLTKKTRSDVQ